MIRTIGLVGTGVIAASHAEALASMGLQVVVYSRSAQGREKFARKCGASTADSLDELISAADVVDICTPTNTHHPIALTAIAAGRHVICEKPLARTVDQALEMAEAARRAGVWLLPAHVVRFYPAYAAARSAVAEGALGEVSRMAFSRLTGHPGTESWFADAERSGGVVMDLSIHDLDAARWIAGEVVAVSAELSSSQVGQRSQTTLTHSSGITSRALAGWERADVGFINTFEIVGSAGVLSFDIGQTPQFRGEPAQPLPSVELTTSPMEAQLREFVDVIEGRSPAPRVTAEDGVAALSIALAATESARLGQTVEL